MSSPSPEQLATRLASATSLRPTLALVLGSGWAGVASQIEAEATIGSEDLPGLAAAGVPGHSGKVICGRLEGRPILILSGRAHYYEGHSMETVSLPVRMLAAFGIHDLLLTNAAGGINPKFRPGQFMRLTDHINFMGENPLREAQWDGEPRFVDLTRVYDATLGKRLDAAAKAVRVRLHRGVYVAVSGPSYETPAEINAFARMGADAVGMSTVPEAIVARACGVRVAAVSCITNPAAGRSNRPLSHEDVLKAGVAAGRNAALLIREFVKRHASDHQEQTD